MDCLANLILPYFGQHKAKESELLEAMKKEINCLQDVNGDDIVLVDKYFSFKERTETMFKMKPINLSEIVLEPLPQSNVDFTFNHQSKDEVVVVDDGLDFDDISVPKESENDNAESDEDIIADQEMEFDEDLFVKQLMNLMIKSKDFVHPTIPKSFTS